MEPTDPTTIRPKHSCPDVCSTRPEDDVRLLMERAHKNGWGTWSNILNKCARLALTPVFGGKRVQKVQEKLGVEV